MKLDLTPEQAFFAGTTRQFLDDKVSMYSTAADVSSWAEIAPAGVHQRSSELAVPMASLLARCGSPDRISPSRCPSATTSVINSW